MFPRHLYYELKPYVPSAFRLALKRRWARKQRRASLDRWPIDPRAGTPPQGWTGWPEGKQFAFVLSHDVETGAGVDRCISLADVEAACGFRSSFNFIPEGGYTTPISLRAELAGRGVEIGVHDLHHDGKLFRSESGFLNCATRINDYLKAWDAVGFRAGFMLHKLDWISHLDVEYDASTFDTDPFEPQPDGVGTIFPFCVPAPQPSTNTGYIELPYTLPQDSTLFVSLGEKTIDVWKEKIDWIASRGGMAMLDTHPDYICFDGDGPSRSTYPVALYREFLEYVREKYAGQYWHALPRDAARHARKSLAPASASRAFSVSNSQDVAISNCQDVVISDSQHLRSSVSRSKIWIDLDNTPHVPFFEPIIEQLKAHGFEVVLTARDAFQVCELAGQKGMRFEKIGRHNGRNKLSKVIGLFSRAAQLVPFVLREKPDLAISHGARAQILVANLFRIPTVLIDDYEFSSYPPLTRAAWAILPEALPHNFIGCPSERVRKYPGMKEDAYAGRLKLDQHFRSRLGLPAGDILITVRPPATEAHYHNADSEKLFARFMDRACAREDVRIVLLPRNTRQADAIQETWPQWFKGSRTIVPASTVDGLNLLWHSDLVVSGGGTMNREAAALHVPVYSIFRGKTGAIDRHLQNEGRLVMIETSEEVDTKIKIERRRRNGHANGFQSGALSAIVAHIESIAAIATV